MKVAVNHETLLSQLLDLGVEPGGVLLVHTAFSRLKPIEDGPRGLIAALREALGPEGTLVMPSMSYDADHVFNSAASPCPEMGIVAETFWRCEGVLRSDSPHAFAAVGSRARQITAEHPVDPPHGVNSPVGRVRDFNGQVLLLGVGQDANTTIHLGEELAGVRYRRSQYVTILSEGRPARFEYDEIDHCCQNFAMVDAWLDADSLQRRGTVGHGEARLARSRDIVKVVTDHLRRNQTTFLHPRGRCEECDDAWASLPM